MRGAGLNAGCIGSVRGPYRTGEGVPAILLR